MLILNRKIAWSKNGTVASITQEGYGVLLKIHSRNPTTGKWELGKETSLDIPSGHDEFPFVHLSWSHLGNDLAVMNSAGHVMIFSCAMLLDRMTLTRTNQAQSEADMDPVVGMHWLAMIPYEQKVRRRAFIS